MAKGKIGEGDALLPTSSSRAGLAARLRAIREEHGLSQEDFAARLGVSKTTAWRYEQPSYDVKDFLLEVCERFDVDPRWLLAGRGEMHASPESDTRISAALVRGVIQHTEEYLQRESLVLAPDKKAQLILTICELLVREGDTMQAPLDLSRFENVIRLVR